MCTVADKIIETHSHFQVFPDNYGLEIPGSGTGECVSIILAATTSTV